MGQLFTNAARGELLSTINSTDTSLELVSEGNLFPVANTGTSAISDAANWFKVVIQDDAGIEVVYVRTRLAGSNVLGDLLRGQDGTVAKEFLAGAVVGLRPLASDMDRAINQKVDKVAGKGLSTKDFTSAEKTKLEGISAASTTTAGLVRLNNSLTSTSTSQALTAAQGKALQDGKADKSTTLAGYGITDAASAGHTHNYIPMTGATNPGQLAYDSSGVDANFLWKKNGVQRWALGKDGADNMALWVYNSSGSYIGAYTFGNGTEAVMPWGLRSRSNIVVEHGSPTIEFRDTDHIVRYVHCNDNNIGFLTSSYGWAARSQDDGAFVVTGNIAAFSDERLKTNIEIIPNALDKVMALRGVTYSRTDVGGRQTGLIAQDVRSVLPEAVIEDDDEMKTLSVVYGNLVGLLVEAIKELKAEVNALKGGK